MKTIADHKRGDTWGGFEGTFEDPVIVGGVTTYVPRDLTGYEIFVPFRKAKIESVVFHFSTSDGTITFKDNDPTLGIVVFMPRNMDVPVSLYVYDIKLTSPEGDVQTLYGEESDFTWNII